MAFGKKDHLVGLDIGSRSIKVAEVEHTKSGRTLKKIGMLELGPELIEDGVIQDAPAVSEAISQLFKTHKIKEKKVALSIGGYSIIVKNINVQTMTEEQLLETIHFEAEQYIPFDINDVNLDFQILGENPNNPNQMSVLLVAAKKEMIEEYINLVEDAGLRPCIIDVDAFALQNAYEASYLPMDEALAEEDFGEEEALVALIDIGASKTSLNILRGATSLFMRDISLGCDQITQQIMAQLDCPYSEAEQIKNGTVAGKMSDEERDAIVQSFSEEWATEVRRALDFFYSSFGEDSIQKILFSGGGTHMPAMRQVIAEETESEVETVDPFKNLNIDGGKLDRAALEKMAPQVAIALGLALRRVDDK